MMVVVWYEQSINRVDGSWREKKNSPRPGRESRHEDHLFCESRSVVIAVIRCRSREANVPGPARPNPARPEPTRACHAAVSQSLSQHFVHIPPHVLTSSARSSPDLKLTWTARLTLLLIFLDYSRASPCDNFNSKSLTIILSAYPSPHQPQPTNTSSSPTAPRPSCHHQHERGPRSF